MLDADFLQKSGPFLDLLDRGRIINIFNLIYSGVTPQVAVLLYHHIGTKKDDFLLNRIPTLEFERQMRYLKDSYEIISLKKLHDYLIEKKSLPRRVAVVTFDDGYKDNYTEAFPILKEYGIPATIFLTTGHIETNNVFWWNVIGYVLSNTKEKKIELGEFGTIESPLKDCMYFSLRNTYQKFKKISEEKKKKMIELLIQESGVEVPKDLGKGLMLSWDNIREMNEQGIEFGAHTITHPILTNVPLDQAKLEIVESKKTIEQKLGESVTSFCYPNGFSSDYNSNIIQILKDNGFLCAVTAIPQMVTANTSLFELGRIPSGNDDRSFKFCVSGMYSFFNTLLSR